jgi:hypothetical protein
MVTLAPMASPTPIPGWSRSPAVTAVINSSGSAPANSTPTATAVTPSRRPAAPACSANSSAPTKSATAETANTTSPRTTAGA